MIRDIYSRDALAPKFNDNMGANLDELIFSLVLSENTIENNINSQITAYCLPDIAGFNVDTKVSFFSTLERDGCLVDIFVNEQRVLGALF